MIPRDTTPEAAAVQAALYRRMPFGETVRMAARMSLDMRRVALEAIHRRHPEYGESEARFALFRMLVGDELFRRAWPDAPLLAP